MDKVIDTETRDLLKGQNMWPEKKTAFLIIHGIGEQSPFETLDAFVRGFYKVLEKKNNGKNIAIEHRIKPRTGDDKIEWVENFISLVKEDRTECRIDFYEYYWAHRMEREITFQELVDWLIKASDNAKKFYKKNKIIVEKYELKGGDYWYLKHLGWFLRLLAFLRIQKIPYFDFIYPFIKPFISKGKKLFIDYMGDVAIYEETDVKNKHYNIRRAILDEAVKEIKALIDMDYEEIIIAGHSLGSVIAYDSLNKVVQKMNQDPDEWRSEHTKKIGGLVTFGSPLDKIAFFFREHTLQDQYVLRQILAHLHCFKNRDLNLIGEKIEVKRPYEKLLDNTVEWINFWDKKDPVSGHLDFYVVDENIKLDMGRKYGISHTAYWEYEEMYSKICEHFLRSDSIV
ncbi:MAG: hypothetical protein A2099_01295 [Planctomycetes bacterium GWF2_39_10]|nr:MAG: hypothetical protein A2099_01295 [Planctomycetes bacterium GWF2_39_10]